MQPDIKYWKQLAAFAYESFLEHSFGAVQIKENQNMLRHLSRVIGIILFVSVCLPCFSAPSNDNGINYAVYFPPSVSSIMSRFAAIQAVLKTLVD